MKRKDLIRRFAQPAYWSELGSAFRVVFYPHPETAEYPSLDVPLNARQDWFVKQLRVGTAHRVRIGFDASIKTVGGAHPTRLPE